MRLFLLSWYLYKATPCFTPPTSSLRDSVLREKPGSCSLTVKWRWERLLRSSRCPFVSARSSWGITEGQWAKNPGFLSKKGKLGSICKDKYSCFAFRAELSLLSFQTIQIRAVCIIFDLFPVKFWRPLMSILCASSSALVVPMAFNLAVVHITASQKRRAFEFPVGAGSLGIHLHIKIMKLSLSTHWSVFSSDYKNVLYIKKIVPFS